MICVRIVVQDVLFKIRHLALPILIVACIGEKYIFCWKYISVEVTSHFRTLPSEDNSLISSCLWFTKHDSSKFSDGIPVSRCPYGLMARKVLYILSKRIRPLKRRREILAFRRLMLYLYGQGFQIKMKSNALLLYYANIFLGCCLSFAKKLWAFGFSDIYRIVVQWRWTPLHTLVPGQYILRSRSLCVLQWQKLFLLSSLTISFKY